MDLYIQTRPIRSSLSPQMSATDRGLVNAFKDIGTMADKLNLPKIIVVSGPWVGCCVIVALPESVPFISHAHSHTHMHTPEFERV